MATWNHKRFRQRKEKLRVSFPYSAPFAISQLVLLYLHASSCLLSALTSHPGGVVGSDRGRWEDHHAGDEANKMKQHISVCEGFLC